MFAAINHMAYHFGRALKGAGQLLDQNFGTLGSFEGVNSAVGGVSFDSTTHNDSFLSNELRGGSPWSNSISDFDMHSQGDLVPAFNIDGTPMLDGVIDVNGHAYGFTD